MRSLRHVALGVLGGLCALAVTAPAPAADRTAPVIIDAFMTDADHDARADRVVLRYSERISHPLDRSRFPFTVSGYTVTKVAAASRTKTLVVFLKEKAVADWLAHPAVAYTRTTKQPVRDAAGNQAKGQRFTYTLAHGRDRDGDGYPSPADCAPGNGSVHPGAADVPEPTFRDANCDGIDGDKGAAVFVAVTGMNVPGCGALASPCLTIQVGLQEAVSLGKGHVYLSAGTYAGPVALVGGIDVYGGFGVGWERSAATTGANQSVTIGGGLDAATGQYLAVKAIGLSGPATVADVRVLGPDAGSPGATSYGVAVQSSSVTLARVIVLAGDGADGSAGSDGTGATQTPAQTGGTGGNGDEVSTACDSTSKGAGGTAGTNPDAGPDAAGGTGGAGGTMDTSCVIGQCAVSGNCDARAGSTGGDAAVFALGVFGAGGAAGSANAGNCNGGGATAGGTGSPAGSRTAPAVWREPDRRSTARAGVRTTAVPASWASMGPAVAAEAAVGGATTERMPAGPEAAEAARAA